MQTPDDRSPKSPPRGSFQWFNGFCTTRHKVAHKPLSHPGKRGGGKV